VGEDRRGDAGPGEREADPLAAGRTRARPRPSGSPARGPRWAPVRRAASWCGRSRSRWRARWSWPRMAPAGNSAVWMLTYQPARPGGDPGGQGGVDVGAAGDRGEGVGQRGGVDPRLEERDHDRPGTPARPSWMWLAVGAPIPDHWSRKQAWSPARRTTARPRPSGSPGPGTSLAPLRVAARVVTSPEDLAEGGTGGGGGVGTARRVSPSTRAAVSATTGTRFRMRLLLSGSSGATGT
jgi:hypothetical protein